MALHHIADVGEIASGQRKLVTIGNKEIGIFNEEGRYYAVLNMCPHAYAPICEGRIQGTLTADTDGAIEAYTLDSGRKVLRCPWHHWEFELETGQAVCHIKQRLKTYPVHVEGISIMLEV
jgi:nitrite reductase/ring-hydroxylating ferredoxin subunit